MNIAIRVDSSFQIGTGHVMRCLNLAVSLRKSDINVIFVCRDHPGHICAAIESQGFQLRLLRKRNLGTDNQMDALQHSFWLGVSQLEDALVFESLLSDVKIDLVIVDHYGISDIWERKIKSLCNKLLVIDDLADRAHYCDILVDQNWFPPGEIDRYDKLVNKSSQLCLGPDFCMLSEDYSDFKSTFVGNKDIVLVFFGGNAPPALYVAVYKCLQNLPANRVSVVNMVIQQDCPERDFLLAQQSDIFKVVGAQTSLASLMAKSNIAIGSGGITTWERMVSKLPSAVITIADNQKIISKNLAQNGFINLLGHWGEITMNSLEKNLLEFFDDAKMLNEMRERAAMLVDGKGTSRVVSNIISLVN